MNLSDPHLQRLDAAIAGRSCLVGVIGIGYVGLPLAALIADSGFRVVGVDVDRHRVAAVAAGTNPIGGDEPGLSRLIAGGVGSGRLTATTDYGALAEARLITLNVETPVAFDKMPDYSALRSATGALAAVLRPGTVVIVESTVMPGTTESLVKPLLESGSDLTEGVDFFLGACPERVMPGKLLANLRSVARVCGGSTPEVAAVMRRFYETFVDAELDEADPTTAELVKVTENTYRDVQIAFANEVSQVCDILGLDVWRVRELVNKVPYRDMHMPGGGVGGHCIPKDPWLLAAAVEGSAKLELIPAARQVNDGMPRHVMETLFRLARQHGILDDDRPLRVAILGYAYLPASDDVRNSPSAALVDLLEGAGAEVVVHDPWVAEFARPVGDVVKDCDAAVLMVAHPEYEHLDVDVPIFMDARHRTKPRVITR